MIRVPRDFKPLLNDLSAAIDRPQTRTRFILFFAAAIVVVGDRAVSSTLRLLSQITPLNPSTYHRLFSHPKMVFAEVSKSCGQFYSRSLCPRRRGAVGRR